MRSEFGQNQLTVHRIAPSFAAHLVPGGHLLLAGLLESQEAGVRKACRRAGLRLAERLVVGDWSILWLRQHGRVSHQRGY